MFSPAADSMNLSSLPSAIIRLIVLAQLESIDDLRLISLRWNSIVSEALRVRTRLPAIKSFAWNLFERHCDNEEYDARVLIAKRYANYFGISIWVCKQTSSVNFGEYMNLICQSTIPARLFAQCSHIEKFVLGQITNIDAFYAKQRALCVVSINELEVSEKIAAMLAAFIRTHLVQKLCLRFTSEFYVVQGELVEFLSDIANEAVKVSFEFSCYDVHKLNVVDHSNYWKETANELAGDKSAVTSIKLCDEPPHHAIGYNSTNHPVRDTVYRQHTINLSPLEFNCLRAAPKSNAWNNAELLIPLDLWRCFMIRNWRCSLTGCGNNGHFEISWRVVNSAYPSLVRIFARCSQVQQFVLHSIRLLREFYSVEQALCDVPLHELVVKERLSDFDSEKSGVFSNFTLKATLTAFVQTHVVKNLTLNFVCDFEEIGEDLVNFISNVADEDLTVSVCFNSAVEIFTAVRLKLWLKRAKKFCKSGTIVRAYFLSDYVARLVYDNNEVDRINIWKTKGNDLCSKWMAVTSLLAAAPADAGCELKVMKIPDQNVHKSDVAGKRCRVDVPLPVCRGFCKTSEEGTHRFPSSHHNSSVCSPKIEKLEKVPLTDCDEGFDPAEAWIEIPVLEKVPLTDCDEGFDPAEAWIEIPVVNHCHCQALP
ncbi:hypothetical protein PRIPAC_72859 [Pristionchus pacificus]|uniref:Uncharacterized protein n=1 Tax=Pristionchus pacificus TaxID=54126 RepID=A0A2A6C092_PRIPA|nr:hypothetical protein PRIPAC_72859 [Pristionchus pacificus]|eukprot:PDM71433.1 hypothetical protein PRIPAC_37840 [Pristionchus pacificus]